MTVHEEGMRDAARPDDGGVSQGFVEPLLDQTRIARLRLTLESRYPGLVSVHDSRFVEQEAGYKRAAAAKVQELLGRETFAELLEKAAVDELVARCKKAAYAGGNLLYLRHPSQGDLALLEQQAVPLLDYFRALFALVHGEGHVLTRFATHLERLHELGAGPGQLNWGWTTYLPALTHPTEAIFIRQKGMKAFRERLGLGTFDKHVSASEYNWYLKLADHTREALAELGQMDMIDVQSIWYEAGCFRTWAWRPRISGEGAGPNPEGLVVLPWNELGDLREIGTYRELEERRRTIVAGLEAPEREGWGVRGARQPFSLAKHVREGHLIAVVPGLREVRGIARVIGPYEYRPEFQGHHAVPVTWLDLQERRVEIDLTGVAFFELDYVRWAAIEGAERTGNMVELRPLPRLSVPDAGSGITRDEDGEIEEIDFDVALDLARAGRLTSDDAKDVLALVESWRAELISLAPWLDSPAGAKLSTQTLPKTPEGQIYPLQAVAAATSIPLEELQAWVAQLRRKGQAILMGPPGTGKTFVAQWLARHLVSGTSGRFEVVQFHPAYAYEDFIEGLRPEVRDGQMHYELRPGHFLQLCRAAQADPSGTYVLILDEINRAPIARVFGELMYLLEYRDHEVLLANGTRFRIPTNVLLLGTMNTADRSIALVDHALRRRFAFFRMDPDYDVLRRALRTSPLEAERLVALLREINDAIGDSDLWLGISFFLGEDVQKDPWTSRPLIWRTEIWPYLDELFYADRAKAATFQWHRVAARLDVPTADSEGEEDEGVAEEVTDAD